MSDTNVTHTASFGQIFAHAFIDSIVDVPGDQGGWVRVYFTRSRYDDADEDVYPIATYDIYRRMDDPALVAAGSTTAVLAWRRECIFVG